MQPTHAPVNLRRGSGWNEKTTMHNMERWLRFTTAWMCQTERKLTLLTPMFLPGSQQRFSPSGTAFSPHCVHWVPCSRSCPPGVSGRSRAHVFEWSKRRCQHKSERYRNQNHNIQPQTTWRSTCAWMLTIPPTPHLPGMNQRYHPIHMLPFERTSKTCGSTFHPTLPHPSRPKNNC